jgi:hypothetical protein
MTTDPTLQTSGALVLSFKNLTNASGGFLLRPNAPTYGPPGAPPPQWTAGTQYTASPSTAAMFGTGAGSRVEGLHRPLQVTDMSTAQVIPGKLYYLTVDCQWAGWASIRLYAVIAGSAAGSTVQPGFGLFNVTGAPLAWKYFVPAAFDGSEFSLSLNNPFYGEPVILTVRYQPPRLVFAPSGISASRLSYTISGGQYGSAGEAAPDSETAEIDIAEGSDAYEIVEGPPAAAD